MVPVPLKNIFLVDFQCDKCIVLCRIMIYPAQNTQGFNTFMRNKLCKSESHWTLSGECICSSISELKLYIQLTADMISVLIRNWKIHYIHFFWKSSFDFVVLSYAWGSEMCALLKNCFLFMNVNCIIINLTSIFFFTKTNQFRKSFYISC